VAPLSFFFSSSDLPLFDSLTTPWNILEIIGSALVIIVASSDVEISSTFLSMNVLSV